MAQTLLQLVDQAWTELGLGGTTPATVVTNTAQAVVNMLNLINGIGQDLVREHQWQGIDKEYRFTTVYYQYTGTTTSGSTTLSALSSTTGLTSTPTYFAVTGNAVPNDTMLVSVNSGASTAVMSQAATATGAATITFAQVFYAMPSDYDRLIDDTDWDKTNRWTIIGPSSAQGWQWLKSGDIATGPRTYYRVLADKFQVYPPLASARLFGFEYISNLWVTATAGTVPTKTAFTVDTDTCSFNDRLMVESLKLRFSRASNGALPMFAYSQQDIQRGFPLSVLSIAKTSDAGSAMLMMGGNRYGQRLISDANIPDGYFNL